MDTAADRLRAQIISKADKLLGEAYVAPADQPLKPYDSKTLLRAPDRAIYRHGATYVVELVFAEDGALAQVALLPEPLLRSDAWSDVPQGTKLSPNEKQWLIDTANQLQPVGADAGTTKFCAVSGPNNYCEDGYTLASVYHFWHDARPHPNKPWEKSLRDVTVSYMRRVSGEVAEVKPSEHGGVELQVGSRWYRIEPRGAKGFRLSNLKNGLLVQFETVGCTGRESICPGSNLTAQNPAK